MLLMSAIALYNDYDQWFVKYYVPIDGYRYKTIPIDLATSVQSHSNSYLHIEQEGNSNIDCISRVVRSISVHARGGGGGGGGP